MSNVKGMMISDRPSASVGGGAAPAPGPGVNIGNYKGVMLCNRPFAGVAATSKANQKVAPSAFLTGVPTQSIGANIPINKEHHVVVNRTKKHTALSRHKKWLADLQKTKDQLEGEMMAEEEFKADKKAAFMDRERKMRAAVRGIDAESKYDDDDDDYAESEAKGGYGSADDYDSDVEERAPPKAAAKKEAKQSKPMWARTEEAAKEVEDEEDEDEAEKLLNFAAGLDFDKYVDDLEVRAMMDQVKARVDELEVAIAEEDDNATRKEELAEAKEQRAELEKMLTGRSGKALGALTQANLDSYNSDGDEEEDYAAQDDDLMSVAESVLSTSRVHSKQSAKAMVQAAKKRVEVPQMKLAAPRVVIHNEEPTRLTKKNDPSNLPYMHRNPAV
jgi:hypothetical protein